MCMVRMDSPLTALAGIGPKKAEMFEKLRIRTVGDLLRHFPRAYQNRGDIRTLAEAGLSGEVCATLLTVATQPTSVRLKNRMVLTKFTAFDDTGRCNVVFFNQNYIKDAFALGATYRFWGRLTQNKNKWDLASPQFEPYDGTRRLPDYVPVYPLGAGISQKLMRTTIGIALASLESVEEVLPADLRSGAGIVSLEEALYTVHQPTNPAALEKARTYFIFEELFLFAISIARAKRANEATPGVKMSLKKSDYEAFLAALPFTLTEAQTRVIREIARDLACGRAMHRLVSGDVGSGKTVCAAAAAYITAKNGYQCGMMAPTEILARQHYADLSPLFESLGVRCALLVGSLTPAKKRKVHEDAAAGRVDFVIGTHALLSEAMRFARPALMITDEQHRFGIRQRATLAEKGRDLHVLVMSATPIPRTLALVMYGDLDVSALDAMPPNRQKVDTFLVNESYRTRLNGFIRKQAEAGRQVYIVCPAIEEPSEDVEEGGALVDLKGEALTSNKLKRAVAFAEELSVMLPGISVGCLHGKMPAAEKDRVMGEFVAGRLSVLVSTTVIEVGVNVPNATLMVIENAERFGLSQLHQLRGRVGRGAYKSWCILVSDSENEESRRRMEALCKTNDGYRIAEFDLEQRGPGDFIAGSDGGRQHGESRLKLASLCDDNVLLAKAFSEAAALCEEDLMLEKEENQSIKKALNGFLMQGASALS